MMFEKTITQQKHKLTEGRNEFGLMLFNEITTSNKDNDIISPLLISSGLGMIHLGATGKTYTEFRQILGYNKYNISENEIHSSYNNLMEQIRCSNTRNYQLNVANKVLSNKNFNILPNYKYLLHINYGATIEAMDFSNNCQTSLETINKWISEKTRGKLFSIIDDSLSADTSLILVNACYFKGNWLKSFNPEETNEDIFYNNGITKTKVKMMRKAKTYFNFISRKEIYADILEMPYNGGDISMYIILPHSVNGLELTLSNLTEKKINDALKLMRKLLVNIYLPKFKIQKSYKLKNKLNCLGLSKIFTDNANLSGICGVKNLTVSDVFHKVYLEIDETGIEAVASNIVESLFGSVPLESKNFRVDHPFLYMIRLKKSNEILFYGKISNL